MHPCNYMGIRVDIHYDSTNLNLKCCSANLPALVRVCWASSAALFYEYFDTVE